MFKKKRRQDFDNEKYYNPLSAAKINNIINENKAIINNRISDSQGLSNAYNAANKTFVDGNRMYIAGTSNIRDIWDDVSKVPFWGDIRNSERYNQASKALKDNPQVDTIISHSLGSSVSAELNKENNNKFKPTTYGAPFLDLSFTPTKDPNNLRYRHPGDPFSLFDTGAINEESNTLYNLINPHSLSGFPDDDDSNRN